MSEIRANSITDAAGTGAPDFPFGPNFTGTPTAPTASVGTNTTQLATTAFVNAEIANDAPTKTGGGASGTWGINVTGNAATATSLSTDRTNWSTNGTIDDVVGQLAWKNYGNNHTIFDASQGTAPNGGGVNNTNAQVAWTGTYPTLMGWNGVNTYGVRVDSARVADSVSSAGVGTATAGLAAGSVGSYALLNSLSVATRNSGATVAGSNLRFANTYASGPNVGYSTETPSGTWQLMGNTGNYDGTLTSTFNVQASVWLRIS
jgi:hypothetical protein